MAIYRARGARQGQRQPDSIAAKIAQLEEMGVHHLHLRFLGELDGETSCICEESAELFAREVMPRFGQTKAVGRPELVGAAACVLATLSN